MKQGAYMNEPSSPDQNLLLRALPEGVRTRVSGHLILVEMRPGDVLYESGHPINDVYFPTRGIVTLLMATMDSHSAEVALVSNEGMLGIELLLGGKQATSRSIVQSAGHAYRLKARYLKAELDRDSECSHLLLRYTQALITEIAQSTACNRHHSIGQHLCRLLLQSMDRECGDELMIAEEVVANMLGVCREDVIQAVSSLQQAGVIEYRRDHIKIMKRYSLEELCCGCYADTKREHDRLGVIATGWLGGLGRRPRAPSGIRTLPGSFTASAAACGAPGYAGTIHTPVRTSITVGTGSSSA